MEERSEREIKRKKLSVLIGICTCNVSNSFMIECADDSLLIGIYS